MYRRSFDQIDFALSALVGILLAILFCMILTRIVELFKWSRMMKMKSLMISQNKQLNLEMDHIAKNWNQYEALPLKNARTRY